MTPRFKLTFYVKAAAGNTVIRSEEALAYNLYGTTLNYETRQRDDHERYHRVINYVFDIRGLEVYEIAPMEEK